MVGRGDHRCGACAGVLETGLASPGAVGGAGGRSARPGYGAGYLTRSTGMLRTGSEREWVLSPGDADVVVGAVVTRSLASRRGLSACAATALAAAALALSSSVVNGRASTDAGGLVEVGGHMTGLHVERGDVISAGWSLSMPSKHRAATVAVTGVVATISLRCGDNHAAPPSTLVLHLPDAAVSFGADATGWSPTGNAAAAAGYQVSAVVGAVCPNAAPDGGVMVRYRARLVSSDTTDLFAMRFHSVDPPSDGAARPNDGDHDGDDEMSCSSASENVHVRSRCAAPWTEAAPARAAPAPESPGIPGGGSGHATLTTVAGPSATASPPAPDRFPVAVGVHPPVTPAAAPSQPAILGPVPVVTPVIEGATPTAAPLGWPLFALILCLAAGLVTVVGVRLRRHADPS
jgi:hypothetical protein